MELNITKERAEKIHRVLAHRQKDVSLVLENIHDPHNVSAIYRSCDAFGIPLVHLYYTHSAFPSLGAKSSASARKWVETKRHNKPEQLIQSLKEQQMQILATNCSPKAKPFREFDYTKPTAIILGNEHNGVDKELMQLADTEVYIPMYGMIQSFNVSVAAALFLSEIARQREEQGFYAKPSYSEEEFNELLAMWAKK